MKKRLLDVSYLIFVFTFLIGSTTLYGSASSFPGNVNAKLYFVENQGQLDPRVAYYVPGLENTLYFTNQGVTFVLHPKEKSRNHLAPVSFSPSVTSKHADRWVVQLDFVGANVDSMPKAKIVTPAVFNYFHGEQKDWKTGVKTYSSLEYSNLWPGINLVYRGTSNQIKYTFMLKPGADPSQIQLAYKGATDIAVRRGGDLEISTPVGNFQDGTPLAYQEINGVRQEVSAKYLLNKQNEDGSFSYGFQIGSYDKSQPLVLDPAIIVYSGFLGGDRNDGALGIAVDQNSNAYIGGSTDSDQTTFPVMVGPYLNYQGGPYDGFIAKIAWDGSLFYVGFFGGPDEDGITDVAVDGKGNAYVTGVTNSASGFPLAIGPDLSYNGGPFDSFVAKIDASGTFLHYSGYIGGNQTDHAVGIAVDSNTNAYVTGQTDSDQSTFPVVVGPDLTYNGGTFDAFVAKVNFMGTALDYCGYIGGKQEDAAGDVAVVKNIAFISGTTNSSESTFPVQLGPDLTYNGGLDAFVARVLPNGSGLFYAGYIGGVGDDYAGSNYYAGGVAADGSGNAYVTGGTTSDQNSFPVLTGPDLTFNGYNDAFIAKVRSNGALMYCGYIGGVDIEAARDVAVDAFGNAYVAGSTASDQTTFPVVDGPDLTFNGGQFDAFVSRVKASGASLDYCGYIGGDHDEFGFGVAIDPERWAYVTGYTGSDELTFPVVNGPVKTFSGGNIDAFVTKIKWP